MKIISEKKIAVAVFTAVGLAAFAAHAVGDQLSTRAIYCSDLKPQQAEGAKLLSRSADSRDA